MEAKKHIIIKPDSYHVEKRHSFFVATCYDDLDIGLFGFETREDAIMSYIKSDVGIWQPKGTKANLLKDAN